MLDLHIRCLAALDESRDMNAAAASCGCNVDDVLEAIRSAEQEFDCVMALSDSVVDGLTPAGIEILAWARSFQHGRAQLRDDLRSFRRETVMAQLLERRSVSPKRLGAPGLDAEEIDLILQAALRAPVHGGLHPWRVIGFDAVQRARLADRFEEEKLRRDPLASERDRQLAREHATRPPTLLAFVVSPQVRSKIPIREQWLAAGAAICNLLNAAHQLGFGAIVLSGERCFDSVLASQLGIRAEESLAGFVSLGRVTEAPPSKRHPSPAAVWSAWQPESAVPNAQLLPGNAGGASDLGVPTID